MTKFGKWSLLYAYTGKACSRSIQLALYSEHAQYVMGRTYLY